MDEIRLEPIKLIPVSRLLDHIGLAMYSKYTKAIGELVVNGFDADATKTEVDIKINEITISDDGSGMNEKGIREGYMLLGSDQKRRIKRTPRFKRLPIGNKGIGKLAGLGIAKRIEVITCKDGNEYRFVIDREEIEKAGTLDKAYHDLTVREVRKRKNGTTVKLTKILPHVKIELEKLRGYLALEIPQDENFKIIVNSKPCRYLDIPAKREIEIDHIDSICGQIKGAVIVAKKTFSSLPPGVMTTVRGRVVGKPSLFGIVGTSHRFTYSIAQLITGKVEVSSFDPEENPDEIPVIQTDREGFLEDHPKYKAYHEFMTDLLIQICREEEKEYEKKKQAEIEAKVQDALKNVADDFNAYNKEKNQEVKDEDALKAQEMLEGTEEIHTKTEEVLQDSKGPDIEERTNPAGITDKKLREELKGMVGYGSIRLGNKRYKITMKPLGEESFECNIDDNALVININIDHPAYDQAVAEKCVEITVFRAIAAAFAWKECETPADLYEKLDDMIRFQALRMQERRTKPKSKSKPVQLFFDE